MYWNKITDDKLMEFSIEPNQAYVYLNIKTDYGGKYPTSDEFKLLKKQLENHYIKVGKAVFNVYENLNSKLFAFKVLKVSFETLGVPTIGEINVVEAEKKQKLGPKLEIIAPQIKPYYLSINRKNPYQSNFDCLSFENLLMIQQDAINKILNRDEIIIGAEAGSGKTIIGCVAAKYLLDFAKKERVLIVALKSIKNQWADTLFDEEIYQNADIIHYENFRNLYNIPKNELGNKIRAKTTVNPKSKFKHLLANNYKVIIFDEIHKVRNLTSDVGICVKKYLQDKPIKHRIALSGTPMVNAPTDLLGILSNFTNHPIGKLTAKEFNKLTETDKGRDWFIKSTKPSIWFKTLEEYGVRLPKLNLHFIPLKIDNKYVEEYDEIMEKSSIIFIKKHGAELAINTAKQNLRVQASKFKKDWIKNFIQNNNEKQVVVMGSFNKALMYPLGLDLDLPVFSGSTSVDQRTQIKKDFINYKLSTLLINFQTGSTGLDGLQKVCGDLILANPVWEIGEFIQAIARVCRLGGQENANIYIPFIDDHERIISIETHMINNLRKNKEKFDLYLKADGTDKDQLAQALMSNQKDVDQIIFNKLSRQ